MRTDRMYPSAGAGEIHSVLWMPDGAVRGVIQVIHGIAEHVERYAAFAETMNRAGFAVTAEDHMGHGRSVNGGGIQGYFHGGWEAAVQDSLTLMCYTKELYPHIPYILFGHSMGSFMCRTMLCITGENGPDAAVICGTGWQPRAILPAAIALCSAVCRKCGEERPNEKLQGLVFGGYNKRVQSPKTAYDWLSRDEASVAAYTADPSCGFTASCGLLRDMLKGIRYIEQPRNLAAMPKSLPVLFRAGAEDPVGNYGAGVRETVRQFRKCGMRNVSLKLYPGARHELLNETNRSEVMADLLQWIGSLQVMDGRTVHA